MIARLLAAFVALAVVVGFAALRDRAERRERVLRRRLDEILACFVALRFQIDALRKKQERDTDRAVDLLAQKIDAVGIRRAPVVPVMHLSAEPGDEDETIVSQRWTV